MGLLKHFEDYSQERLNKSMTVPGFIGYVVSKSPKEYHKYLIRDLKKQDEFKAIEMIIHGYVVDGSVDGMFKAADYLKNYHDWNTETPTSNEKDNIVININVDERSVNNGHKS